MKLKNGATESVQIIGFNPESGIGGPWRMKEGNSRGLKVGNSIEVFNSLEAMEGVLTKELKEYINDSEKVEGVCGFPWIKKQLRDMHLIT